MNNSESRVSRYWPLIWALVLSLWVHILFFALLRYAPPVSAEPSPLPIVVEFQQPEQDSQAPVPPDEPKDKDPAPVEPESPDKSPWPEAGTTAGVPEYRAIETADAIPPDEDVISLESQAPEYISFLAKVKAMIMRRWVFPPEARQKLQEGRLTIIFTLSQSGDLVRTILEEGSGYTVLDDAALEAVRGARPFPRFPEHITLPHLNIRAHFDYRIRYITVK